MQPTAPQSQGAADMDLPAVQSVDWLFKKEKIFLLAQFWQQRATLAENEIKTLKEQLSTSSMDTSLSSTTPIASSTIIEQNGISPPSPSTTPLSESSVTINLNNKLDNNNDNDSKMDDDEQQNEKKPKIDVIKEAKSLLNNNNNNNNISNNNTTSNSNRTTPTLVDNKDSENNSVNNNSCSNTLNNNSTRTLTEELATKDKEISALFEEVARLRQAISNIQESHNLQIQRLEDRLEEKRQTIVRLESRIEKSAEYDDIKKENSILRSVDLSTSHDTKQFQELLLERTKALAAQNEAIKSSNSDGSPSTVATPLLNPTSNPSLSSPSTPNSSHNNNNSNNNNNINLNRPASTPINNCNSNNNNSNSNNNTLSNSNSHSFLPPPLQNVEQFGSFLGEEIVSNWRRGIELPPPPPGVPTISARPTNSLLLNHHHPHLNSSPSTDLHSGSHRGDDDKNSSHHESSSTASTPVLQDTSRHDEMNGGGVTPMSTKSPLEDNNNSSMHLSSANQLIQGLPFHQFQERPQFRFAEDLHMPPGSMVSRLGDSLIPKGDPMEAKLQEMLRYNMDKYANQNLDTLHISRRVRELLSVHNIGQRLFAKYVLGLSQGTVSELLSKPKPWDKLTEKGRDSYRKMHAWACDDNAILLLKSLIPKKEPGMPQYGRPDGDNMNDDRLQHILNETSSMMPKGTPTPQQQMAQQLQLQQQQLQQLHLNNLDDSQHSDNDSKSPNSRDVSSPFSKDYLSRRLKKYENDDIPQEKIAKIYQEEFAKLIRTPPSLLFPHLLSGGMPPMVGQDDNIRLALEAYHRELAKLQQTGGNLPNFPNLPNLLALQQQALNGAQDLSLPKEKQSKMNGSISESESEIENNREVDEAMKHSAFSLVKPKQEPGMSTPTTTASSAPSPLGNNILPPAITPTEEFSVSASPLQRMASITNSLITQPPVTPHHSSAQRPLKAILPPITQQQFDMYNNLNTEDIVRRVKEALSQYSISQRLFGESVLGLSQGSVSDLLARPKPWHMLTQKGREPFIRMKMFLEDENAVHKLVASQYKIAPEKLMRTGSYSGSPQIPASLSKQMPPMPKMINDQLSKLQQDPKALLQLQMSQMQQHMPPTSQSQQQMMQQRELMQQQQQQQRERERERESQNQLREREQASNMLLTPPGLAPQHAISLQSSHDKSKILPVHSPTANAMRSMNQHISPTVYEMAALTQDLDTQIITTKIKEALLANNIGQKIFGEAVLGLSQGSVSELLSKPKPWHMLSIKGREPFIRMQLWLSDANNVERLQLLKNERREASKRRRSTGPGAQDNSSDTSSNDTSEFYHSNSPGPGSVGSANAPPNKKQRVLFSEEQKEALKLAFALDPYPNVQTIEFLANELNLSTRTITNWFHNHRMRLKQQVPHGAPSEPIPSRENTSGQPFDPVQFRVLLNQRLMDIQKERMGLTGVPLPYPPYFANPQLAALISRGLLPGDVDLAALNNAVKEQMSGLDLSMPNAFKRDGEDDFEDDNDADSHVSDNESVDGVKNRGSLMGDDDDNIHPLAAQLQALSRTSRRKPAAPQWVNPDWQDDKKSNIPSNNKKDDEIINGVCVMQQADGLDPASVQQRFAAAMAAVAAMANAAKNKQNEEDNQNSDNEDNDDNKSMRSNKSSRSKMDETIADDDDDGKKSPSVKKEIEDEPDRWEY